MSTFAKPKFLPDGQVVLSTLGPHSIGAFPIGGGIITAGTAWAVANQALYIPFRIASPFTFNSIAAVVSTATGNIDMGVYAADGTKIVSTGSVVTSPNVQQVSVASTTIGPGLFYFGVSMSSISGGLMGYVFTATGKAGLLRALGISQQATALPLPATATFAANTGFFVPVMGITNRSFV